MLGFREERVCGGGVGKAGGMGWGPAFVEGRMGQQVWLENLLRGKMSLCRKAGEERWRCSPACVSPRAASPLQRRHVSKQAWGTS